MRLERAGEADRAWLRATLGRISRGLVLTQEPGGALRAVPAATAPGGGDPA
jgi:poly-gamma-glutamate synthesis protein (capsule biosynthesis protein)